MAAYATTRLSLAAERPAHNAHKGIEPTSALDIAAGSSVLDAVIDQLAARVVERLVAAIERPPAAIERPPAGASTGQDEWFDSRHAADYLGIHRDTLRKLAAERAIPCEQDGPNCKLYFRRADLDAWRLAGGRPRHLATTLSPAA
jgi:excisionase family DNA binding protein